MPLIYDRADVCGGLEKSLFRRALTPGQRAGIGSILDAWERLQPSGDTRFLAYCLATAWWETAHTMLPVPECGRGRGRAYGEPAGPWRQAYYGRGLVQLTWIYDYEKAESELHRLGVLTVSESLVRTPDLALRVDVAAAIMIFGMKSGWFTGRKLADYFNGLKTDWINARRIINGTDKAETIAAAAEAIFTVLKHALVLGPKGASTPPAVEPPPAPTEPAKALIASPARRPVPAPIPRAAPNAVAPSFLGRVLSIFR